MWTNGLSWSPELKWLSAPMKTPACSGCCSTIRARTRSVSTIPPSDSSAFMRRATSLRVSSSSCAIGVFGTLGGGALRGLGLRRRPRGRPPGRGVRRRRAKQSLLSPRASARRARSGALRGQSSPERLDAPRSGVRPSLYELVVAKPGSCDVVRVVLIDVDALVQLGKSLSRELLADGVEDLGDSAVGFDDLLPSEWDNVLRARDALVVGEDDELVGGDRPVGGEDVGRIDVARL